MKVTFFPFMPCCETGSSRVRAYWMASHLTEQGVEAQTRFYGEAPPNYIENVLDDDVIVFQKTYSEPWIRVAEGIRKKGIKIVLDQVEKEATTRMHGIADVLTTDSTELAEWYHSLNPGVETRVIEDCVAYLKTPLPPRRHTKSDGLKIAYFVSPSMMDNVLVCHNALKKLEKRRNYELIVIAGRLDPWCLGQLKYEYWKWSVDAFTGLLRKCDLAILPQKWTWKGGNKMVQAVTHNLPTVASDTPAYRRIAEATGTEEFLCKRPDEWLPALEALFDPVERNRFLAKTSGWVWDNYNIGRIARQWMDLFEELV